MAQPGAIIGLADGLKKEAQVPANTCICFNFLSESAKPSSVCSRQGGLQSQARKSTRAFILLQNRYLRAFFKSLHLPPGFCLFVCFDLFCLFCFV